MIARRLSSARRLKVMGAAPAVAALLVLVLTEATALLPPLARNVAIGFIVASLLFGFVPKRENVRTHGSVVAAIIAVAVSGATRTGLPYQVACGLFVAVAIAALRAPLVAARLRAGNATTPGPAPRYGSLAVIAAIGAAVTVSLLTALPPASRIAEREIQRMAGDMASANDQVGFSSTIRVGSLTRMLRSDRVVMRVGGEPVEYLRGAVLDRYELRFWTSTQAKQLVSLPANAPALGATTHIELSRAALTGRTPDPHWFLPSDACDIHTPSGRIKLDPHGSASPDPPGDAREIGFRVAATSSCVSTLPEPLLPNGNDLGVSPQKMGAFSRIARVLTKDATTSRTKLDAIIKHLAHFTYALEDHNEGREDPVLEFLERDQRGHCELFASALALLARSIGIPTRLVVGYRVDEVNSVTRLAVVRDRNAHTWVDAWVDGRWESFDPTPSAELLASTRASRWESTSEVFSFAFDRTVSFFASITLLTYGIVSAALAVVLILVRRFMQRRRIATRSNTDISRPLPAFERLATALTHAGWPRIPSEPLERFARRLDQAGLPWSAEVADALDRYAELRYGGIGEERTIARRLDELSNKIAPTS